jgi:hypothetical protein
MKAYQKRVVEEKRELDKKLAKLHEFINDEVVFRNVHIREQELLRRQEVLMEIYSEVLGERIEAFNHDERMAALNHKR